MRALLIWLARWLPEPRVIYDREGGTAYLSRWYLLRTRPAVDLDNVQTGRAGLRGQSGETSAPRRFDLFLHRFHRSDDDLTLHNHPWAWALSLVLVGGYSEERRVGDEIVRRRVGPLSFNFIRGEDYHRVDLLEADAWSLFLVGPKVSTWYFWDRFTKRRSQWRRFIEAKRGLASDAGWEQDSREAP